MQDSEFISNKTFDQIKLGDSASIQRTLTLNAIHLFAAVTENANPMHLDKDLVEKESANKIVGHGAWVSSLVSNLLGNELPGPGTLYKGQISHFHLPVEVNDTVEMKITVAKKENAGNLVTFDCIGTNSKNQIVFSGTATVAAPTKSIRVSKSILPEIKMLSRHHVLEKILEQAKQLPAIRTSVCHPCDKNSLLGAIEAAQNKIIIPVLFGPKDQLHAAAKECGISLNDFECVFTEHYTESAALAVEYCRTGKTEALMKGSLHTDELMHQVMNRETGLRTKRRISHVYVMSVPTYPKPLLITDAAINIYPTLEDKIDICQNAIDLAIGIGINPPRVAILSAVETVHPKITSTLDAAALCKMADRGQIKGGLLDGPLAFDNAVSPEAVKIKKINSQVAGQADILVAPDLEAANMIAKQLDYLAGAATAGIVLGARVPIMLTSRAESAKARLASSALASLAASVRRQRKGGSLKEK